MELNLRGKSAAITGASKGIGLAIAEELAREGVNLRLVARNREELQRAADDLRSRSKRRCKCRYGSDAGANLRQKPA